MNTKRIIGVCAVQYHKQVTPYFYLLVRYPVNVEFCLLSKQIQDNREFSPTSFFSVQNIFNQCQQTPADWPGMIQSHESL